MLYTCTLLLIIGVAWVVLRATSAARHLAVAQSALATTEDRVLEGDALGARTALAELQRETQDARDAVSDPVWRLYERLPLLGRTLQVTSGIARACDMMADDALPSLVAAADQLRPERLRPRGDTVAIEPLVTARAPLARARDGATRALERVSGLPVRGVIPLVGNVRAEFQDRLGGLAGALRTAATAAEVAPPMLGQAGARRYLLAVQTNAEGRATGGLLGAFGVIEVNRGRFRLVEIGTNSELQNTFPRPAVDVGPEFTSRYRRFAADSFWINANMSPHLPYASTIWLALFKATRGQQLDGTIAVDPVAMREMLEVTGPILMGSRNQLGADRVVDFTMREAYSLFKRNEVRDRVLQAVAEAVYNKVASGAGEPRALIAAMARAAGGGHLQVASAHPAEQSLLATTPLGGELPVAPGPFAQVVTQNAGGNKLDYYLRREVRYALRREGGERRSTVSVRLRNTAPRSGLPLYVVGRVDLPGGRARIDGRGRTYLSVYLGQGASLLGARLNGQPLAMESELERGHPVFSTFVEIDPGATLLIELDVLEGPGGPDEPVLRAQPMVVPDVVAVSVQ